MDEADAEPKEGRSRHLQQLREAMGTVLSFSLVDCVSGLLVFHGPAALSKSWVTFKSSDTAGLLRSDAELKNF